MIKLIVIDFFISSILLFSGCSSHRVIKTSEHIDYNNFNIEKRVNFANNS